MRNLQTYERAMSHLKDGKKESEHQKQQQCFMQRRADYLAAAMQASLKGEYDGTLGVK